MSKRHLLQATQQIKLPRWVQAILRLPGGVIILALIMLPLTLVGAGWVGGMPRREGFALPDVLQPQLPPQILSTPPA